MTTVSAVVLTMGGRRSELATAVASIRDQRGVSAEVVVVGNGTTPEVEDPDAIVISLPENVGVSRGRNHGWRAASGDIVFFLDDDARYESAEVMVGAAARFQASESLAVLSFRIVDDTGTVAGKHMPMLRKGHPERVARATAFLGGACAIRRSALEASGGFPDEFFYGLEETDLAWRLLDLGWDVEYAGDLGVIHPPVAIADRDGALFHTARSRVFLVRRRLPIPLALVYLPLRGVLSLLSVRSWQGLRSLLAGYRAGFREPAGERRPISWGTAWRMTRLGRPPVV